MRRVLLARGYASSQVRTPVGRVHYLFGRGDGDLPPHVLLHGFSASAVQLAPVLRHFKPSVQRLVAIDLPGHGFSEVPRGVLDPQVLLDGIFAALDDIIREPVVLFGNSMGGFIALRYALHAPQNVKKLALISPGGAAMDQQMLDELRKIFHVNSHGDALEFVDRLMGERSRLRHLFAVSVRRRLSRADLLAVLDAVRTDELLTPEDLGRLTVPTLCVWGREDEILPRANLDFFRTHLPEHSRVVEPERFGHSPYLEAPRALAKMVTDFVREPTSSAA
ncbi:MAG: alpha/beta fold hydrolase [Deltaproteobacteria bacterium]